MLIYIDDVKLEGVDAVRGQCSMLGLAALAPQTRMTTAKAGIGDNCSFYLNKYSKCITKEPLNSIKRR